MPSLKWALRDEPVLQSWGLAGEWTIGRRAPGPSHGADVDEDGNGLVEPGAEAYAFTFG